MYSTDLAHVHDAGFGHFARDVGPEIVSLLRRHGLGRASIVEIGCGSGAVARQLSDCGHRVLGYDISPAMIRLARRAAPRARFRVAPLETAPIPRCAAVVAVGEIVTYVGGGLRALERFFARANASLEPGGLLVFDFISSTRKRTYEWRSLAGSDWSLRVRATFDASTRVLTRDMRIARRIGGRVRRSRETHRVRVYSRRQITAALRRAGFSPALKTTTTMTRSFGRYRLIAGDVAVVARKSTRI